ncbi:MAG: FeoA family protein [Ramlibacter sp.]
MNADTVASPVRRPDAAAAPSAPARRLDEAPKGVPFRVRHVDSDPRVPERARQLEELGFFAGEQVMVMTRGFPGADPLVVRIGQSTFALRRAEAACVHIEPMPRPAAG